MDYQPKTSIKNLSLLLQKVTVLVVDPDKPIANIIKHMLSSLGFGNILVQHDGEGAAKALRDNTVDFIICDVDIIFDSGEGEQPFIEFIRTSPNSPNKTVPIIVLTGHTEKQEIESTRDMGVSEVVAKPFTAKQLCDRVVRIIENPRSFIITKRYTGPDRRRREEEPPKNGDRRDPERTAKAEEAKRAKPTTFFKRLIGKTS